MRCKSSLAIAAALAIGMAVSAPAYAQHHHGGHWGHYGGHWGHRGHGGFGAALGGFAAGALLGSALAAPGYYYYDAPGYGYYDAPDVYAEPDAGAVAYCEQRFRSYDPASGTYLGYDGLRHPCP
jgi:BA14K-like protein